MKKERRYFDREFKLMAVNLCLSSERSAKEVADELGIRDEVLRRWIREHRQYGKDGFSGHGKPNMTDEQREMARLKSELRDAQIERDILKKAVAIFSRKDGKSISS